MKSEPQMCLSWQVGLLAVVVVVVGIIKGK